MATKTVNPYTFVPLRAKGENLFNREKEMGGFFTGVIRCTATALTPVSICDEKKDEQSFPFFSVAGEYIVPGSSLRGVIRSVYESVTDSCMRVDERRFHARSKYKMAGILTFDGEKYWLQDANRYRIKDKFGSGKNETYKPSGLMLPVGERCAYELTGSSEKAIAFNVSRSVEGEGLFLRSDMIPGMGSSPSLFVAKEGANKKEIAEIFIKCLAENISLYDLGQQEPKVQKPVGVAYAKAFARMKNEPGFELPVWYLETSGSYEFAPSQVSRSVYAKSPADFIDELGLAPCRDKKGCCPACDLFGFVAQGKNDGSSAASAGKLRFGNGVVSSSAWENWPYVKLSPLMSPRVSSLEFYLRAPLGQNQFTPNDDVTLSGRMIYWHHKGWSPVEAAGRDDLLISVQVMPAGTSFDFDVFVENAAKGQVEKLIWALTIGDFWIADENARHCHKIGRGKPLGLGSIQIKVRSIEERAFNQGKYSVVDVTESFRGGRNPEWSLKHVEELKAIANYDNLELAGKEITYPYLSKNGANQIFTWFAKNRPLFQSSEKGDEDGSTFFKEVLARDGRSGYINPSELGHESIGNNAIEEQIWVAESKKKLAEKQSIRFKELKGADVYLPEGFEVKNRIIAKCPHCGKKGTVAKEMHESVIKPDPKGDTWCCSNCH